MYWISKGIWYGIKSDIGILYVMKFGINLTFDLPTKSSTTRAPLLSLGAVAKQTSCVCRTSLSHILVHLETAQVLLEHLHGVRALRIGQRRGRVR